MKYRNAHGGDWAGFQEREGREPLLDFSVNISPLGIPAGVREAAENAARRADRYPDPECRTLRAAVGMAEGVPPEWILCGNGAADLIYRMAFAARFLTGGTPFRALVTDPAFSEYAAAVEACGGTVRRYPLRAAADFRLDPEFLSRITPEINLLFLCQPNNPTGVTVPGELSRRILSRCRETGTRLVMDECFTDFLDAPEAYTLKGELRDFHNLVILRSFTKLYGMAGIRLGYALCADSGFLDAMARSGPPWNVSLPAQAAGIAALAEREYVQSVRALIAAERPRLLRDLRETGMRVIAGEGNFLLFQSPVPLDGFLRRNGILIRGCGNFAGLDESWYRAAVRTGPENRRLAAAVRAAAEEVGL